MCIQEENGRDMKKVIDSPDDLFKVGWKEEKVAGCTAASNNNKVNNNKDKIHGNYS